MPVPDDRISLDIQFRGNPEQVPPGATIAFAIVIKNTGTQNVDPVYIAIMLPPDLQYIPGSTVEYRLDTAPIPIADSWVSDGLNLGLLLPGDAERVLFSAQLHRDAEPGSMIESVVQLKRTWLAGDSNEWIQCAAHSFVARP